MPYDKYKHEDLVEWIKNVEQERDDAIQYFILFIDKEDTAHLIPIPRTYPKKGTINVNGANYELSKVYDTIRGYPIYAIKEGISETLHTFGN